MSIVKDYWGIKDIEEHNKEISQTETSSEGYYKYIMESAAANAAPAATLHPYFGGTPQTSKTSTQSTGQLSTSPAPINKTSGAWGNIYTNPSRSTEGAPSDLIYNPYNAAGAGATPTSTTPAASTTTAAGAVTSPQGYYEYLMTPKSAEQWRADNNINTQRDYDKAVRQAETDYLKAQASYGQKAEQLGRAGLSGSGYGDYITGVGYAASQNAKLAASEQKAAADVAAANSYAEYLTGVNAANVQLRAESIEEQERAYQLGKTMHEEVYSLASQGWSEDDVRTFIGNRYGIKVDNEMMEQFISSYEIGYKQYLGAQEQATIDDEQAAADEQASQQIDYNKWALEAAGSGYTANQIYQQMISSGVSEEQARAAVGEVQNNSASGISDAIAVTYDINEIPTSARLKQQVALGNLTQEQANALLSSAQARRGELLRDEFEMVDDTTIEGFFSGLDALYKSGDIGYETYKNLHVERVSANIEGASLERDPATALLETVALVEGMKSKVGSLVYGAMMRRVESAISTENAHRVYSNSGGSHEIPAVKIKVGGKAETVEFSTKPTDFSSQQAASDGKIVSNNGKLYVYYKNPGKWYEIISFSNKSVGGKENADALYNLLIKKLSSGSSTYIDPKTSAAANKTLAQSTRDKMLGGK